MLRGAAHPRRRAVVRRLDPQLLRDARRRPRTSSRPTRSARALAARKPGVPLTVVDTSGDPVSLDERETIAIDVTEPDEVRIGLPRDRFPTEDAARAALASRGGEMVSALGAIKAKPPPAAPESGPLSSTPEPPQRWTFVVQFPAAAAPGGARRDRQPRPRTSRSATRARPSRCKLEDVSPAGRRARRPVVRPGAGAAAPPRCAHHRRHPHHGAGGDPGRRLPAGRGRPPARARARPCSSRSSW